MAKTLAELWQDMDDARRRSAALKAAREAGANVAMQADAAVRGAANAMTFGLADNLAAYANTKFGGSDYQTNLAREAGRTAYDHENRRAAQLVGEVAGTGLALGAAGPRQALAGAARLPGVAQITSREAASALGAGAAVGAGMQGVGDIAAGRVGTPGDYMGAAAGGAVGVAALPLGFRRAGALSGGATSAAQDLLNGRAVSPESLQRSATAGAVLGGIGANLGGQWSKSLSAKAKGDLGEAMGRARSIADWRPRDPGTPEPISVYGDRGRPVSKPDGVRGQRVYEDKFGPYADLTKNQRLLRSRIGDLYSVNHFLPWDVGALASVPSAAVGAQVGPLQRRQP